MEHTPEPWSVYEGENVHGVLDSTGRHLAEIWLRKDWDSLANARRIVACVNACRGMGTEALETKYVGQYVIGNVLTQGFEDLMRYLGERDEARAMAQRYLDAVEHATKERDEARAMVKELADALDVCADALRDLNLNERGDPDDGYSNVEKARLASDKARAYLAALT